MAGYGDGDIVWDDDNDLSGDDDMIMVVTLMLLFSCFFLIRFHQQALVEVKILDNLRKKVSLNILMLSS